LHNEGQIFAMHSLLYRSVSVAPVLSALLAILISACGVVEQANAPVITPTPDRPGWFTVTRHVGPITEVSEPVPLGWAALLCADGFNRQRVLCSVHADEWLPKMTPADQQRYEHFVACIQGQRQPGRSYTSAEAFAIARACDPLA
jgi:hypothetical protein